MITGKNASQQTTEQGGASRKAARPTVGRMGMAMCTLARPGLIAAIAAAVTVITSAQADDKYPSKPVRMVVSFAAGGPTDIVARVMSAKMSELLGQQFVVE